MAFFWRSVFEVTLPMLFSRAFEPPASLHLQILFLIASYSQRPGPHNVASADGLAALTPTDHAAINCVY